MESHSVTTHPRHPRPAERAAGWPALIGTAAVLAGLPVFLLRLVGPPRLPSPLPTRDDVLFALRGSDVPLEAVGYALGMGAWALWLWITGALLLRLALAAAEAATHGAAWVTRLRALSDRVTPPLVRRLVDGAVVATVVTSLATRAAPATAYAAPTEGPAPYAPTARVSLVAAEGQPPSVTPYDASATGAALHTVAARDTLWSISERYYGTGWEYPRIVEANLGRRMDDGRTFTRAAVIHPGWTLRIPLPAGEVEEDAGGRFYEVRGGDTLRGIAARLLGDEARWEELFRLNRGAARTADGRTLVHEDLIWPGLRLRLPAEHATGAPQAAVPDPEAQAEVAGATTEVGGAEHEDALKTGEAHPIIALDGHGSVDSAAHDPELEREADSPLTGPEPAEEETGPAPPPVRMPAPPTAGNESDHRHDAALAALAAAGVLGVAGAGAGALAAARRHGRKPFRRSLDEPPAFAAVDGLDDAPGADARADEADCERVFAHRLHGAGAEPAVLAAEHVRRLALQHGLDAPDVVTAVQGRTGGGLTLDLALQAGRGEREALAALAALAAPLAARLAGTGRAALTPDGDLLLSLAEIRSLHLLAAAPEPADRDSDPDATLLLPLGALSDHHVLHAGWRQLGHTLIAGPAGGGGADILAALVAGLAARRGPGAVRLKVISSGRSLPAALASLPHVDGAVVEPSDANGVRAAVGSLSRELVRRLRRAHRRAPAGEAADPMDTTLSGEVVVVVEELADLQDGGLLDELLEVLDTDGPAYGMRVLAATARPQELAEHVARYFGTRAALRLPDEDLSVRLLGTPDAADLGRGRLVLRLDGRHPVELRGFHLPPERLDQLVRSMAAAYGAFTPPADPDTAAPALPPAALPAPHPAPPPEGPAHAQAAGAEERPAVATASDPGGGAAQAPAEPPGAAADTLPGSLERAAEAMDAVAAAEDVPEAPRSDAAGAVCESGEPDTGALAVEEAGAGAAPAPVPVASPAAGSPAAAPLIELRCFGPRLEAVSGERVLSPAAKDGRHAKPWEILAFLAVQPDGVVSREKLQEAFWPEEDPEETIDRLNTNLMRLRKLLAEQVPGLPGDVVRNDRSDGTVRLDTRIAVSDVQQFLRLCRLAPGLPPAEAAEAYELARALYRDDLLHETPFGWVHDRETTGTTLQEHLQELRKRATTALARLYAESEDPARVARAVPLCRELLRADPLLEEAVRILFACYGRLGDAVSLAREHRQLLQALREACGPGADERLCQPERATVAAYERALAAADAASHAEPAGAARAA